MSLACWLVGCQGKMEIGKSKFEIRKPKPARRGEVILCPSTEGRGGDRRSTCVVTSSGVLSRHMEKQIVSFRLDADKVGALDTLAQALDRDRSYLLNEAVESYLEVQQWHIEQIKAGIRQADRGKLIDHSDVKRMAARWRRR